MEMRQEPVFSTRCAACGGRLVLLAEIPPRDKAHSSDAPHTAYFRCENCAQIKILEH